jgi:hypothetical protein
MYHTDEDQYHARMSEAAITAEVVVVVVAAVVAVVVVVVVAVVVVGAAAAYLLLWTGRELGVEEHVAHRPEERVGGDGHDGEEHHEHGIGVVPAVLVLVAHLASIADR